MVIAVESLINENKVDPEKIFYPHKENRNWNLDNYGPLKIPKNDETLYFVLGDNRHNSIDSRIIGFIKDSDVIGIVKK